MSVSVNKVVLIGRLGSDPKISEIGSGKEKTKKMWFSLATDRIGKKSETDWHSCTLWGKLAEALEPYLKKGKLLYVEGVIKYWKDKEEEQHTEIEVKEVKMLDKKE